jgi:hypothetical protein
MLLNASIIVLLFRSKPGNLLCRFCFVLLRVPPFLSNLEIPPIIFGDDRQTERLLDSNDLRLR